MLLYFGIFWQFGIKKERFLRLFFYFFIKNYEFHMKKSIKITNISRETFTNS